MTTQQMIATNEIHMCLTDTVTDRKSCDFHVSHNSFLACFTIELSFSPSLSSKCETCFQTPTGQIRRFSLRLRYQWACRHVHESSTVRPLYGDLWWTAGCWYVTWVDLIMHISLSSKLQLCLPIYKSVERLETVPDTKLSISIVLVNLKSPIGLGPLARPVYRQ